MDCEHACGGACAQEHCGACCGGACAAAYTLTPAEYALLQTLAVTPFLPVASNWDLKSPVYLEETEFSQDDYAQAILALSHKGLLRIDYDIPLKNFGYSAYCAYPMHGSVALTGAGQELLERIEIQDIVREE